MSRRKRFAAFAIAFLVAFGTPLTAWVQDICPVFFCQVFVGNKICSYLVNYPAGTIMSVTLSASTNVISCNTTPSPAGMYRRFRAVAMTTAPTSPRSCSWNVVWNPGGGVTTNTCLIDSASDGLPVELMDFKIE